ncbi:MAG: hypothetical protein U9Q06_02730 [Nanoarchaeota archaeon]|nr:hypothetical protein [Nanoarchaeota archaeon]
MRILPRDLKLKTTKVTARAKSVSYVGVYQASRAVQAFYYPSTIRNPITPSQFIFVTKKYWIHSVKRFGRKVRS